MSKPTINGTTFTAMRGSVLDQVERLMPVERPGVDGAGFLQLGELGKPFQIVAWLDLASASSVTSQMATLEGWIGDSVTIVDALGVSWTGCVVLDVVLARHRAVAIAAGGVNGSPASVMMVVFTMMREG